MPKFTIIWVVIYTLGLIAAFVNPVFGALTYLFEYYLRPSLHWWGIPLPDLRWNFTIAAVMTAAFILRRGSLPKIVGAARGPGGILLALAVWMLIMTPLAVSPDRSLLKAEDFLKLILFQGIIVGTLRSEKAFDWFVAVHMLGAGWWGWEAYRDPVRQAGRLLNIGSGDSLGDNAAALHLLTVIPFALFYLLVHKDKRLRGIAFLALPFVANAIILCNSRGATVGLLCAAVVTIMIAKSGHRLRAVVATIAVAVVFYALADPEFIERQQTTTQGTSAGESRVESWAGGLRLIANYPFGAGGAGYALLSPIYIPEIVAASDGENRAPHNTLILVASEWGIPGLMLFLSYYVVCASLLREVRKSAGDNDLWYYRSAAIQMSMVGLFVGGFFTDRLYAEAPYWMGGLAVALHRLNRDRLLRQAPQTEATSQRVAPSGVPLQPTAARSAEARA